MTEKPSDTSDFQRFDEMFAHLTPLGATIPYSAVFDQKGNIWVAAKGGLFKLCPSTKRVLWEKKNKEPKKMAAYCQVCAHEDKIIYSTAEDKDRLTQFFIFELDGTEKHSQYIDGLVQSITVNEQGDIFITKQLSGDESTIFTTSMDAPLGWSEVISSDEEAFQTLCAYDNETLVVAATKLPINMYSSQTLKVIDIEGQKVKKTFSKGGKNDGEVHFPRAIRRYEDDVIVLDKTGRFQRFTLTGEYKGTLAAIDAYLGNGFAVKDKQTALVVCSGIVQDRDRRTICDDWLEEVPFDGSSWKEKRHAQAQKA